MGDAGLRPDAVAPPDGRNEGGLLGHADVGDPERPSEPKRLRSQRMQLRIWHQHRLRQNGLVHPRTRFGLEPCGGVGGYHGTLA